MIEQLKLASEQKQAKGIAVGTSAFKTKETGFCILPAWGHSGGRWGASY